MYQRHTTGYHPHNPRSATSVKDGGEGEIQKCIETLKLTSWFMFCSEASLRAVALNMHKESYKAGDTVIYQGDPHTRMFVVADGHINRLRTIDGQKHLMEIDERGSTVGAYYIMNQDPCYSDALCRTDVVCYSIGIDKLEPLFNDPLFAKEVAYNLNLEIRRQLRVAAELGHTPLLEQYAKPTPYAAISVAAALESFYRSAMNASINAALSGQTRIPKGALFPNMHLQVPTRIIYINGFKGIRHLIDSSDFMQKAEQTQFPTLVRLMGAVAPGLCMTPISSLLEAYNAGHMNPEPLQKRWMRGVVPRSIREIIFGVGLNQLSDYWEERTSFLSNPMARNAAASVIAGVIAGYLSHVPHNLSTLKLLQPHKSYAELFREYAQRTEKSFPAGMHPSVRRSLAVAVACVFPRGLLIRTVQIVGSFTILNGTINALQKVPLFAPKAPSTKVAMVDDHSGIETAELFIDPRVELMRRVKLRRQVAATADNKP